MLDVTINVVDHEKLDRILEGQETMIVELEDLKTKVTNLDSAVESAKNLILLIKQKLDEALASATTLQELKDGIREVGTQLEQESQELADAVAANTPAA